MELVDFELCLCEFGGDLLFAAKGVAELDASPQHITGFIGKIAESECGNEAPYPQLALAGVGTRIKMELAGDAALGLHRFGQVLQEFNPALAGRKG